MITHDDPLPRVDIHSHVLPGFDDGARDCAEALSMLRVAAADGTGRIVATPHAAGAERRVIEREVERLNQLAAAEGLRLTVLPGSEVMLAADLPQRFRDNELVTINATPYLLLELPLGAPWSSQLGQAVYTLQLAGAWPILAHAERYPAVQRDPWILVDLIAAGLLVQVNADSLSGTAGKRLWRAASLLIRHHLAHLIASDAHGARLRPPVLTSALAAAMTLGGEEYVQRIAGMANQVIRGEPITPPEPITAAAAGCGSRLGRLLSRAVGRGGG